MSSSLLKYPTMPTGKKIRNNTSVLEPVYTCMGKSCPIRKAIILPKPSFTVHLYEKRSLRWPSQILILPTPTPPVHACDLPLVGEEICQTSVFTPKQSSLPSPLLPLQAAMVTLSRVAFHPKSYRPVPTLRLFMQFLKKCMKSFLAPR